jgi:Xaa-Pro aminopeptidase
MFNLRLAQSYMLEHYIDGWLIYDFRGSNPIMWQILGKKSTTRRTFLFIPSKGEPRLLTHVVDKDQFSGISFPIDYYISWNDMNQKLREILKENSKIAMEYSPNGSIPAMSWVDGGTLELIRSFGVEICSSADLFQVAVASWSENALKSHLQVGKEVAEIKDMAFDYIKQTIKRGKVLTEYDVQEFIMQQFQIRNLETEDRPIVAVNENSGNPHYQPSPQVHSQIKKGDWVLIDLWARYPGESNVFSDITWVGYVGQEIPSKYQTIFEIVKKARDLVVERLESAFKKGETFQGWELDMVARNYIQQAGYGKYFIHRTGHSLSPGPFLHGLGVNLDNLETHDTRKVLPGLGFSIEPGIYLPEFGVRLEINVYMSENGPIITTPIQNEIIKIAEG